VAVSGFVSALFTSALVFAQAPASKPAAPPAGAQPEHKVEKVVTKTGKAALQKAGAKGKGKGGAAVFVGAGNAQGMFAVAGQPNRDPLIQQVTTQARPMVRAELIFVRNICKLDRESFRQINRDADQVLKEVVNTMVDAQIRPRVIVRAAPAPVGGGAVRLPAAAPRPVVAGAAAANLDGGKLLQNGLAVVMKKHLSPEQWSHYQAEVDKRDASRKQSAIRYLVDSLDRELYLSDQQREKLTDALSFHWHDRWYLYLEYVLNGNPFYPLGVDPIVTPLLTDAQKKVWQGFQKMDGFWGFGGIFGGFMNDNDALEEELGEVRK